MARKANLESEKAATEFSDAVYASGSAYRINELELFLENAGVVEKGYGLHAIRDICNVMLALRSEEKYAADSAYVKELEAQLRSELANENK